MTKIEFVKNLENIFSELDISSLNFPVEEILDNEELAEKFYNLIASKYCEKYSMNRMDFDRAYDSIYNAGFKSFN